MWTYRKIQRIIDQQFSSTQQYLWVLDPSPFVFDLSLCESIFREFFKYANSKKIPILHAVQSLEHEKFMEKMGFTTLNEVHFFYSEKKDDETNLPKFNRSDPPLKFWLMSKDPNENAQKIKYKILILFLNSLILLKN